MQRIESFTTDRNEDTRLINPYGPEDGAMSSGMRILGRKLSLVNDYLEELNGALNFIDSEAHKCNYQLLGLIKQLSEKLMSDRKYGAAASGESRFSHVIGNLEGSFGILERIRSQKDVPEGLVESYKQKAKTAIDQLETWISDDDALMDSLRKSPVAAH